MAHVSIYDTRTNESLAVFTSYTDTSFPFLKVFDWATDGGRFVHVVPIADIGRLLLYYRLPDTSIFFSQADNVYVCSYFQFTIEMVPRFKEMISFIYSLLHENKQITIRSISTTPSCLIS